MKKSTKKSILFVGNHALLHKDVFIKDFEKQFEINSLTFKSANPFVENESNKILINDLDVDFNGIYDLNNLTLALSFILEHNTKILSADLIIGDPSEVLFQAFSFARLKENPLFFKQNTHKRLVKDTILNLFIYPMGMLSFDIRKEISNLVYVLKKHQSEVLLLRKDEKDLDQILNAILTEWDKQSIYDIEERIEGLEHLIGKPKELIS